MKLINKQARIDELVNEVNRLSQRNDVLTEQNRRLYEQARIADETLREFEGKAKYVLSGDHQKQLEAQLDTTQTALAEKEQEINELEVQVFDAETARDNAKAGFNRLKRKIDRLTSA